MLERGYEGYVARDEASPYIGGVTRSWLKVKVPGWTDPEDKWKRVRLGTCDRGWSPHELRDLARFGYLTGWRVGEIATLAWVDVDRGGRRITLRPEHSKNGQARVIPFVSTLSEIIERRWAAREYKARSGAGISPWVFHRDGQPIRDFRGSGRKACAAARMSGLLFHDLRRSAVRNLVAAGVDQAVAIRITGHKTASVFQRYRIVADDDIRVALERAEAMHRAAPAGTVTRLRL